MRLLLLLRRTTQRPAELQDLPNHPAAAVALTCNPFFYITSAKHCWLAGWRRHYLAEEPAAARGVVRGVRALLGLRTAPGLGAYPPGMLGSFDWR